MAGVSRALDEAKETDLAGVMFGRDELLQVAEIVEREGQPVRVARIAVRARRGVLDQADASPRPRLEGKHALRRRDLEQQIDRPLAAIPGEEAAHDGLGHAADAPLGERLQRRSGRRPGRLHPTATLVPLWAAGRAHALEQESGGGLGGGHAAIIARPGQQLRYSRGRSSWVHSR
jgi:hypothetical protein